MGMGRPRIELELLEDSETEEACGMCGEEMLAFELRANLRITSHDREKSGSLLVCCACARKIRSTFGGCVFYDRKK